MGTWGTGLYANDTTSDVRDSYLSYLRNGVGNEEATRRLQEEFLLNAEEDPDEEALFWFALADTQWDYGQLMDDVKEKALIFLEKGPDPRWEDADEGSRRAWARTLKNLNKKLLLPPPPKKNPRKSRKFQCKWQFGDAFAYRFVTEESKPFGFYGKYVVFRKVSETRFYPDHRIPIVMFYGEMFDEMPQLENISFFKKVAYIQNRRYYLKIAAQSEKDIPTGNLQYLGNIPGDDCFPYNGTFSNNPCAFWPNKKGYYCLEKQLCYKWNLMTIVNEEESIQSEDGSKPLIDAD